jgi:hypothetical protein
MLINKLLQRNIRFHNNFAEIFGHETRVSDYLFPSHLSL